MSLYQKMVLNYLKDQRNSQLKTNKILNSQQFNQKSSNQKSDSFEENVQNFEDQSIEQFINTSEKINVKVPYKTLKPRLIQSLLSFKDQMMQQMDIKKQLFQSKTLLKQQKSINNQKIINFYQNLNQLQSESKHKDKQQNPSQHKQQNELQNQQQNALQHKQKKKIRLRKKSSYKNSEQQIKLDNKQQKDPICLQKVQKQIQVSYLQKIQQQQSTIMNRLLDIIQQKQKSMHNSIYQSKVISNSLSVSRKVNRSKQNTQKTIVINNYLKPEQSKINEELMKRQLKIKLLQLQRQKKRNQIYFQKQSRITVIDKKNEYNQSKTKIQQESAMKIQQDSAIKIQQESSLKIQYEKVNLTSKTNNSQQKELKQQLNYKKIQSSVNEFLLQSIKPAFIYSQNQQTKNRQQRQKKQKKQLLLITCQQQHNQICTNEENTPRTPMNQIIQHNQTLQNHKQSKQMTRKNQKDNNSWQNSKLFKDQIKKIQQRRPVLFQIPISQNQTQSISLAQAFKKKIKNCKLATEKRQEQRIINKNNIKTKKQNIIAQRDKQNRASQRNQNQTDLTYRCTEVQNQFISDINQFIPNKNNIEETKRTNKSVVQKKNIKQIKFDSVQSIQSSITSPRQPSKQLLDRLIYGNKAKIDKKQMYALTKKNYQKLPQVQNKRKMQQKKAKELQRLQKMKDFQKQIRSSKSSLKS